MVPESYLSYRIARRIVFLSGGLVALLLLGMQITGLFLSGSDGAGVGWLAFFAIMLTVPVLIFGLLVMATMWAVSVLSSHNNRPASPVAPKTRLEKLASLFGYASLPGLFVFSTFFLPNEMRFGEEIGSVAFTFMRSIHYPALMVAQWSLVAWFLLSMFNLARKSSWW